MHLIITQYSSDADRKRIEYIFNKYESEKGDIDKMTGISRIIHDDNVDGLLSELYLRTSPDNIKVYQITEVSTKDALDSGKMELQFIESKDTIESFINYLLAQRKAIFLRKIGNNLTLYTSTTRKGYAEIQVGIFQKNGQVSVHIEIHAEEPNRSFLLKYFTDQLELFKKSLTK